MGTILNVAIKNGYTTVIDNIKHQLELGHTSTSMIDELLEPVKGLAIDYAQLYDLHVKMVKHYGLDAQHIESIKSATQPSIILPHHPPNVGGGNAQKGVTSVIKIQRIGPFRGPFILKPQKSKPK